MKKLSSEEYIGHKNHLSVHNRGLAILNDFSVHVKFLDLTSEFQKQNFFNSLQVYLLIASS